MELLGIGLESALFTWFAELIQSEVAKMTFAFMLAARLHRAWVKKDMTEQFASITAAINNVADKLTLELNHHSKRVDDIGERVSSLERKITKK